MSTEVGEMEDEILRLLNENTERMESALKDSRIKAIRPGGRLKGKFSLCLFPVKVILSICFMSDICEKKYRGKVQVSIKTNR